MGLSATLQEDPILLHSLSGSVLSSSVGRATAHATDAPNQIKAKNAVRTKS